MDIAKELGLRIRHFRKKKRMTQEKLAEICCLHPTYIGQLERGEKNPTVESICRIARGLEIPVSKLLENIEAMNHSDNSIPMQVYHLLLTLPPDSQVHIANILSEIVAMQESS